MHLCINWSAELGVWTVYPDGNDRNRRVVAPQDIAEGAPLHKLSSVFQQARQAVESGRAVLGICVEV